MNAKILLLVACVSLYCTVDVFSQNKPDALKMYKEGRYDDARAICLDELNYNPKNIESYVVLTWSLIALGRYADAENYAQKAYSTIRREPRIVEALGEAAYYLGKNEQALNKFIEYINLLPDGSRIGQVYYFMGEVYLRMSKYEHADIAISMALQYEPNNAKWWTRLGYIRERASNWLHSLNAYESALQINSAMIDAQRGRDRVVGRVRR